MPLYDYKCTEHGVFELFQPMADYAEAKCPHCEAACNQTFISAPGLDIEGMADAGCPGAFVTSGNRITKRHIDAGQGEPRLLNK